MKLSPVKRGYEGVVRQVAPSLAMEKFVRQVCDEFVEVGRENVNFGRDRLVGGFTTFGRHSALILIHGKNRRRGTRRITESVRDTACGFQKAGHLMQLAHKFRKPVVVCLLTSASASGLIPAESHEVLSLQKHLFSQWCLDVPIVLVILASMSPCDIFGVWLADKCLALDQTQFALTLHNQKVNHRFEVNAKKLARSGIIDRTISVSPNFVGRKRRAIPSLLRNALIQMLDEIAGDSPEDLRARRQERLVRVEEMVANMYGQAQ